MNALHLGECADIILLHITQGSTQLYLTRVAYKQNNIQIETYSIMDKF